MQPFSIESLMDYFSPWKCFKDRYSADSEFVLETILRKYLQHVKLTLEVINHYVMWHIYRLLYYMRLQKVPKLSFHLIPYDDELLNL